MIRSLFLDIPFEDTENVCFDPTVNDVETISVEELEKVEDRCKVACRKNQKLMWLKDPSSPNQCFCTSQPLVSRILCPDDSISHYKMESTGLGHPMLPFSKTPTPTDSLSLDNLGSILDSSLVQVSS